jgi:hypothetical protein
VLVSATGAPNGEMLIGFGVAIGPIVNVNVKFPVQSPP